MKKVCIIIFIYLFTNNIVKSQVTNVLDTLGYLKTIASNKANYIGKPFSVLLKELKIQIKYFSPFARLPYDKTKETSTSFCFYFPLTEHEIYLIYPCLDIYWQIPLDALRSSYLYSHYSEVGWNATIASFYKKGIIADIKVRE
jgi:hypothetical protein